MVVTSARTDVGYLSIIDIDIVIAIIDGFSTYLVANDGNFFDIISLVIKSCLANVIAARTTNDGGLILEAAKVNVVIISTAIGKGAVPINGTAADM